MSGDVDCDGSVNAVDALKILRHNAGLPVSQTQPCTAIGVVASTIPATYLKSQEFTDAACIGSSFCTRTLSCDPGDTVVSGGYQKFPDEFAGSGLISGCTHQRA